MKCKRCDEVIVPENKFGLRNQKHETIEHCILASTMATKTFIKDSIKKEMDKKDEIREIKQLVHALHIAQRNL